MMQNETWAPIPDWPWYEASSEGRIRSVSSPGTKYLGKILSPAIAGRWKAYLGVRLWNGDTQSGKTVNVHNLVMAAFVGPRLAGMEINHRNGVTTDNSIANLEYVTKRQNETHATANGLHPRGVRHHAAKLTEDDIRAIRSLPVGARGVGALPARYGVSRATISAIRARHTWKHVAGTKSKREGQE